LISFVVTTQNLDGRFSGRGGILVSKLNNNGMIISVANNKGGTGKTTVSCNLAHAMAKLGYKVLLVDMDSQVNATSLIMGSKSPSRTLYDLLNPEGTNIPVENCIHATSYNNLYCLPNIQETAGLEPDFINGAPESFFTLRNKLRDYACKKFDFTFIDNPPNMGTFVIISLYASDCVIVPNESGSSFSMEGLVKMIRLINNIRENGNKYLRFLRLLINKVDRRTAISKATISYISDNFKPDQVFKTHIPICTAFQKAEGVRQTILNYAPSSSGAKYYRLLATELESVIKQI